MEEELQDDFTASEFEANEERKTNLRRIVTLGILIFLAVFYFVWQNILNFGYLEIKGETPYNVMVYEEKTHECKENPCTIKLKRGEKNLSFSKPGYEAEFIKTTIKLWETVSERVYFELIPYLRRIPSVEESQREFSYPEYELEYDRESLNWKLVKKSSSARAPLAYFPEKIMDPLILGSNDSVLIMEKKGERVYFIDLNSKQKNYIGNLKGIFVRGKPSIDGRFFLLEVEKESGGKSLFLADKTNLRESGILSDFEKTSWTLQATLASLYKKDDKHVFSIYDPAKMFEKTLIATNEFGEEEVGNFFPSMKKRSLFFEVKEAFYEIVY